VGSFTAPWDWRCYVNERFSKEDFRKRTELAVELICSFVSPLESRVIVLMDSTYCCAEVIRAAHQRGFTLVGLCSWPMGGELGISQRRPSLTSKG
jgi:hypothetical protein